MRLLKSSRVQNLRTLPRLRPQQHETSVELLRLTEKVSYTGSPCAAAYGDSWKYPNIFPLSAPAK